MFEEVVLRPEWKTRYSSYRCLIEVLRSIEQCVEWSLGAGELAEDGEGPFMRFGRWQALHLGGVLDGIDPYLFVEDSQVHTLLGSFTRPPWRLRVPVSMGASHRRRFSSESDEDFNWMELI